MLLIARKTPRRKLLNRLGFYLRRFRKAVRKSRNLDLRMITLLISYTHDIYPLTIQPETVFCGISNLTQPIVTQWDCNLSLSIFANSFHPKNRILPLLSNQLTRPVVLRQIHGVLHPSLVHLKPVCQLPQVAPVHLGEDTFAAHRDHGTDRFPVPCQPQMRVVHIQKIDLRCGVCTEM